MSLSPQRFTQETEYRPQLEAPKPLGITQLQTTVSTIYTAESDADFLIEGFWVSNVTGSAASYTIYLVPDGGSAGTSNAFCSGVQLAANTYAAVEPLVGLRVAPGTIVQALCSSNDAINLGGSGRDVQGSFG